MARLNRTMVKSITPPVSGELVVMDDDLPGFGLRVLASGARSYFVRYRAGGGRRGKPRRITLGRHETLTPEQARNAAKDILARVRLGDDPAETQSAQRASLSVSELIDEWMEGAGRRNRHGKVRSEQSQAFDRGRLNHHVKPVIGRLKVSDVRRQDIERLRDAIAAGQTANTAKTKKRGVARVSGGEGAATRTLRTLSCVFGYAVQRGHADSNPVSGVRKSPDRKNERFLSQEELTVLGGELAALVEVHPKAVAIIRLLTLTGCRRGEIEKLQWREIDLEHGCLRLMDTKTGARNVFLSAEAARLLEALPRQAECKWVFPASTGASHYQNTGKVWTTVRKAAGLAGVRLHDLRHTFASRSLAEGVSLEVIAVLLGHKERRTTERYAHLAADPIREAASRMGRSLGSLLDRPVPDDQTVTSRGNPEKTVSAKALGSRPSA